MGKAAEILLGYPIKNQSAHYHIANRAAIVHVIEQLFFEIKHCCELL